MNEYDLYLFKEGTHSELWKKLGAHVKKEGVEFAVWAPNARYVSVVGDFNSYDTKAHPLKCKNGIWEANVKSAKKGDTYKYYIIGSDGREFYKADPFAFYNEKPPKSASVIWEFEYKPKHPRVKNSTEKPVNIYEVHLGSWKKGLSYVELANELSGYCIEMGYNYIEILPITEYPFDGSWGYQASGYFAPTSRYGTPDEFMEFVDIMHKNGIGVILDWVPSHFAVDGHGLITFDGSCLFEHCDPRLGYHPEWKSHIFDYSKAEVRSFLISSAHYWFERYNIDGIRVDAVASMLYLDYGRSEWVPNEYGGNINLSAVKFLKTLNKSVHEKFENVFMIAEESTTFPNVTKDVKKEGLGFDFKWNMGWMNDILRYFHTDPLFRKGRHGDIAHIFYCAFSEKYILPLSHDEVVHGKGSLINKMPGGYEKKFENLKALLAFMYGFFGKKLIFMGGEFAQFREWDYKSSLEWFLIEKFPKHREFKEFVKKLNRFYLGEESLWDDGYENFKWINYRDYTRSVFSYIRGDLIIICNFADFRWENYITGAPSDCYEVVFDTKSTKEGTVLKAKKKFFGDFEYTLTLDLEPLSVIFLKNVKIS
ncbi:1,4-alpha-glucan branching protein GlgB [Nautilia sp.]